MLNWPHRLYNRPKGRRNVCSNMFSVMISLLWPEPGGWILHKTTQLEGSYQF